MRTKILFTSILLSLFTMLSISSFAALKQERKVESFTKIKVGTAFKVYLTQGSNQSVVIEIDDEYVDDVKTTVTNGTLDVSLSSNSKSKNRNIRTMNVYITVPNIEALHATAASKVEFQTPISCNGAFLLNVDGAAQLKETSIKCKDLNINISGAGKCSLAVTADNVDIEASGASKVELNGTAKQLDVDASGASKVDVLGLKCEKSNITKSGAASVLGYK